MSEKEPIRGKHDSAHHVGRASNVRAEQEADAAQQYFLDTYGVPFNWAIQMSQMDSDIGKRWKSVLEHINDQESTIDHQP